MPRAFADPQFPKEFHKFMGDEPAPRGNEELEKAIKEVHRDHEVGQLCQKLAAADPPFGAVNGRCRGDKAVDPVGCRDGVNLLNSRFGDLPANG